MACREFYFYAGIPQQTFCFPPHKSQSGKIDSQLCFIQIPDGFIAHHFPAKAADSGQGIELLPGLTGQRKGLCFPLPPFQRHLLPGQIQRSQKPVMGTRRLNECHSRCYPVCIRKTPAAVKHGCLCQRARQLMRTLGHTIGTAGQRIRRQFFMKSQMSSVSLIDQHNQPILMGNTDHLRQLSCQPVIGRIRKEYRSGVFMGSDSRLQTGRIWSERYLFPLCIAAFHVRRHSTAQNQAAQDTAMGFSGNEYRIAGSADRQDHRFNTGGRTVDGKESPSGAICISSQLHSFTERSFRLK